MAAFDEKEYIQDFDWSIWKRIFPIMGRYKGFLAGMIASSALSCAADVLYPLFQRHAIAGFIEAGALDGLGPFARAYAAVKTDEADRVRPRRQPADAILDMLAAQLQGE